MKISEWLTKTFGGKWRYSGINRWVDDSDVNREATLVGDDLRVIETRILKA